MNKNIEDYSLKEIKELKEQYSKEFEKLLFNFFKERPLLGYIHLRRKQFVSSISFNKKMDFDISVTINTI